MIEYLKMKDFKVWVDGSKCRITFTLPDGVRCKSYADCIDAEAATAMMERVKNAKDMIELPTRFHTHCRAEESEDA